MQRRIAFQHTMNTRDLGGYPTRDGPTRYHSFIRSDAPILLTDGEMDFLQAKKLTTIVDLRSNDEVHRKPCFLADKAGFTYYHFPLSGQMPSSEQEIPVSYGQMLLNKKTFYNIFKTFAEADNGTVFHCTAGKDRTGVIAALLLKLVDVPLPDILADYQVTHTYIAEMVQAFKATDPSLPFWLGQSKPEYLLSFFDAFSRQYPSVEAYLEEIGLSGNDISSLKKKLLYN